jgi:hypothetical protein
MKWQFQDKRNSGRFTIESHFPEWLGPPFLLTVGQLLVLVCHDLGLSRKNLT